MYQILGLCNFLFFHFSTKPDIPYIIFHCIFSSQIDHKLTYISYIILIHFQKIMIKFTSKLFYKLIDAVLSLFATQFAFFFSYLTLIHVFFVFREVLHESWNSKEHIIPINCYKDNCIN